MAIRFQCAACSEPIEVDNEWARQVVRCPYCQRTVTAPAESVLPSPDQIPMATPSVVPRGPAAAAGLRPITAEAPVAAPAGNASAAVALILAFASVGFLILAVLTVSRHPIEIAEIQKIITEERAKDSNPMAAMAKYINAEGGGSIPGWMMTLIAFEFASLATWLGSVVFGLIGVFRVHRRGMAVGALVTAGLLGGFFCLTAIMGGLG